MYTTKMCTHAVHNNANRVIMMLRMVIIFFPQILKYT